MMGQSMKVIVFGASGNVGSFLVKYGVELGHQVTAFVRQPQKLKQILGSDLAKKIKIFAGDALDEETVAKSLKGQQAVVNAAAPRNEAEVFKAICCNIVTQAQKVLLPPKRVWLFGGLPGLNVPHTNIIGSDLPGMRPILRSHKANYQLLKKHPELDWSFICPGPMFFASPEAVPKKLKITLEEMPYKISRYSRFLPSFCHSFIILRKVESLAVSYQDVARFVMANLEPNSVYRHQRVGLMYQDNG